MPYVVDRNLGWNAGARSRKACLGDCQLEFSVPESNSGVCIGFNNTVDASTDFREIKHGLVLQLTIVGPRVFVYESGVQKFAAGEYASADKFTVRRNGSVVSYLKNNVLLYTSLVSSAGAVFVDTSLYAGGDSI